MIVLKSVYWNNLFSYGEDNELNLDNDTVTQIVGDNGDGKTSIILIIQELLYNKNSKGIKKANIANRYTDSKGYNGGINFEVDNKDYLLTVSRKGAKLTVELLKDGDDISEHTAPGTYKKVLEILGLDFNTFEQLVYQSSTESLAFLKATDTTRKAFLIKLLGLDEYTTFEQTCKSTLTEVTRSVDKCRSSVDTTRNWLNTTEKTSTEKRIPVEFVDTSQKVRNEIASINSNVTNVSNTNASVKENKKRIKRRELLQDILDEYLETDFSALAGLEKECEKLKQQNASASAMLGKLDKLHRVCPTCMSDIDEEKVGSMRADYTETLETNRPSITSLSAQIRDQYSAKAAKIKRDQAAKEIATIELMVAPTEEVDLEDLQAQLAKAKIELGKMQTEMKAINAENLAIAKHNDRIEAIAEQKEKYIAELEVQEATLGSLEERLARLVVLRRAFSTKGLVAYKIESMVKDLEDLINEYLQEFSDGRFTLMFTVAGDKLNVDLTDDGQSIDINTLSSGELARVNTSTLLAIRKLLSSLASNRLNLLFLDEILNVLDEFGKQKLIEILNAEEGLNTFIVSHGWEHPLVAKLHVQKENNISRIEADG